LLAKPFPSRAPWLDPTPATAQRSLATGIAQSASLLAIALLARRIRLRAVAAVTGGASAISRAIVALLVARRLPSALVLPSFEFALFTAVPQRPEGPAPFSSVGIFWVSVSGFRRRTIRYI